MKQLALPIDTPNMRPILPFLVLFYGLFLLSGLKAEEAGTVTDPALIKVLDEYIESRGGQARLVQVASLTYTGAIFEGDKKVFEIVNVQKQPNMSRVVLEQGNMRMVIGYDGIRAWVRRELDGQRLPRMELGLEERDVVIREADFIDPLIHYKRSGYTYTLLNDARVQGTPCYVVEVQRPNMPGKEVFYLEKETGTLLKRVVTFPSDSGEKVISSLYSDYRFVEGIPIAYEVRTRSGDGEEQVILWDSVIPNKGVFDSYFSDR